MADQPALLDECMRIFDAVGLLVRHEHLDGSGGGLCEIRGQSIVFVDLDADLATRIATCARVLGGIERVEQIFVTPALRERIEQNRAEP